jgi:cytochrome c5
MKKFLIFFSLLLSGVAGFSLSWWMNREVLTPPMEIYHYPATFVKQLENDKEAGKKIFKEFCSACHAKNPTIDVHAPLLGDKARWDILKKLGMPALLNVTIHGIGAMPARGGCFECSDVQLEMAVQYMLDQ